MDNSLPVTLTGFNATFNEADCMAQLQWQIADQRDFSQFDLERSVEGTQFLPIVQITAKENRTEYYFKDQHPLTGKSFYRLKMIDKDGRYTYSHAVTVYNSCNLSSRITVYPNPTHNKITISGIPGGALVTICSLDGKEINRFTATKDKNVIDISNALKGVYILKVSTGKESFTEKIIID